MNKLFARRSIIRENLALLVGVCLCFYFSYHAVQGNRSITRLMALDLLIASKSAEYDQTHAQRIAIESDVRQMRPGSVSRDLLEERARAMLGYRHKDELDIVRN